METSALVFHENVHGGRVRDRVAHIDITANVVTACTSSSIKLGAWRYTQLVAMNMHAKPARSRKVKRDRNSARIQLLLSSVRSSLFSPDYDFSICSEQ